MKKTIRCIGITFPVLNLLGLALVMGASVWLGRLIGIYTGQRWGNLIAIFVAMAVGFAVALIVGKFWEKTTAPMKA